MKQIRPIEQLKWIVVSVPTAGAFSWSLLYTLNTIGVRFSSGINDAAPMLGVTAMFGWWMIYQCGLLIPKPRSRRKPVFEHVTSVPSSDPDIQSYRVTWKEDPVREFDFVGLGLPCLVPESTLSRFVRLAHRRQVNAVYGGRGQLLVDNNKPKRLTTNQIFTRRYFTHEVRPRFDVLEYDSCLHILMRCRMVIDRYKGRGGKFRGEYGPDKIVDVCQKRWQMMLYPVREGTDRGLWSNLRQFLPARAGNA